MMKKIILIFALFIFQISSVFCEVSVYMTHVQKDYDQEGKLIPGIENLLAGLEKPQIVILQNNQDGWLLKLKGHEQINFSQYGEHKVKPLYPVVFLVGAQLGACLQFTIRDLLKMQQGQRLEIIVDSRSVLSIEGELLSDKLAVLKQAEAKALIHHYFSRTLFLESDKWVRHAKINVFWQEKLLGSLKDQGFKKPTKNPNLILTIH